MTRKPLVHAVVALALVACAPETADRPFAPTAPSAATPARRGSDLPFRGALDAKETHTFDVATNRILIDLTGDGTATHVGRYTLAMQLSLNPATGLSLGKLVLTAADGSALSASVTGEGTVVNELFSIIEIATITGGTGRFAGVAGRLVIERTAIPATLVSWGSVGGVITF